MNLLRIIGVLAAIMSFALVLALILGSFFAIPYGNIAVINIHGLIMSQGDILTSYVDATRIVDYLDDAELNPVIEAVILDIDSGGGTVVGSSIVMEKVLNMSKPVIALIRETGASGAYWIASACDRIVAHEFSTLGSIGVSSAYLDFSGLLERYNVSYVNLSIPEFKDMLSPYKEPTQEELDLMMDKLQTIYDKFVQSVAGNRNISLTEMQYIANGAIYLGYEALELGLVDVLGSRDEAVRQAMSLSGVEEPLLVTYAETISIFDLLTTYMSAINPFKTQDMVSIRT